jgi:hypothetical protein
VTLTQYRDFDDSVERRSNRRHCWLHYELGVGQPKLERATRQCRQQHLNDQIKMDCDIQPQLPPSGLCPTRHFEFAPRTSVLQRKRLIANGSFVEAQFQSYADPSALIHHGQHRAPCCRSIFSRQRRLRSGCREWPPPCVRTLTDTKQSMGHRQVPARIAALWSTAAVELSQGNSLRARDGFSTSGMRTKYRSGTEVAPFDVEVANPSSKLRFTKRVQALDRDPVVHCWSVV